jgi:chromosome partitioning protein
MVFFTAYGRNLILRKIAVAQGKGGTAKTTTAVNLAAGLALAGHSTLIIDLDTQGQVAPLLGVHPPAGIAELVLGEQDPGQIIVEARDQLFVLAGGASLAGVKRMIARQDYGGEHTLAKALAVLEGKYHFVVLDTAPSWDTLNVATFFYATEILVPVSLETMALQGLVQFIEKIKDIQVYRPELQLRAILPTFFDRRVRQSEEILAQLKTYYGALLYPPIRYNIRLSEAPSYKQTIYEFAPQSAGAEDYRRLVERIIQDGTT